jgi:hypothetical protein
MVVQRKLLSVLVQNGTLHSQRTKTARWRSSSVGPASSAIMLIGRSLRHGKSEYGAPRCAKEPARKSLPEKHCQQSTGNWKHESVARNPQVLDVHIARRRGESTRQTERSCAVIPARTPRDALPMKTPAAKTNPSPKKKSPASKSSDIASEGHSPVDS